MIRLAGADSIGPDCTHVWVCFAGPKHRNRTSNPDSVLCRHSSGLIAGRIVACPGTATAKGASIREFGRLSIYLDLQFGALLRILEAIALRLEGIASRLEAIPIGLDVFEMYL